MALSASTVIEIRTAGSDTNGGGFVTGAAGSDWSQQDAARTVTDVTDISTTDAVAIGTTTLTSATANFAATIVGNIVYIAGGTGTITGQWRQITARTNSTTVTMDASIAASTGMTLNIGGALASLGQAGGYTFVSGTLIWIKSGTYTISSASTNISGGCFSNNLTLKGIQGYQSARGDLGTAPLLQASGISTFTIIDFGSLSSDSYVYNVDLDGAGLTASQGISARGLIYKCRGLNFTNSAFRFAGGSVTWLNCVATGCSTTYAFKGGHMINCLAYDNTFTGFEDIQGAWRCISDSNSGATSDGFLLDGVNFGTVVDSCVSYNNGRDGFRIADDTCIIQNSIAESNGSNVGINNTNQDAAIIRNNATFGQTTAITVGTGKGVISTGNVTGSASFFTDAPNRDFTLNNTAGAGAVARGAGYPGVFPT